MHHPRLWRLHGLHDQARPSIASALRPTCGADLSSPAVPPSANRSHPHLLRRPACLTHVCWPSASTQWGDALHTPSWCPCDQRKGCSSTGSRARCICHPCQDSGQRERWAGKETASWLSGTTPGYPGGAELWDVLQPAGWRGCSARREAFVQAESFIPNKRSSKCCWSMFYIKPKKNKPLIQISNKINAADNYLSTTVNNTKN